jgi:general secretion pathway protein B
MAELPPELRRQLPALAVGGSVWSDNPASRFVILNGQLLHEGQALDNGVALERLLPKAALLRWRGMLIEWPL